MIPPEEISRLRALPYHDADVIDRLLEERDLLVAVKDEAAWLVGHVSGLAENNPNLVEALDAAEDFR